MCGQNDKTPTSMQVQAVHTSPRPAGLAGPAGLATILASSPVSHSRHSSPPPSQLPPAGKVRVVLTQSRRGAEKQRVARRKNGKQPKQLVKTTFLTTSFRCRPCRWREAFAKRKTKLFFHVVRVVFNFKTVLGCFRFWERGEREKWGGGCSEYSPRRYAPPPSRKGVVSG